jgi:rod shape determining protein RodA
MFPYLRKILRFNLPLLALMIGLAAFGVTAIYAATYMRDNPALAASYSRQMTWCFIGFGIFVVVSLIDYKWIRWGAIPMYLMGIGSLIALKFIGKRVYGAQSWIRYGGFSFQPSQLAILAGILMIAFILSDLKKLHPALRMLIIAALCTPPMLMIMLQRELGGALVWVPTIFFMMFAGRIPIRYLLSILIFAVACMPLAFNFLLKPYQRDRILVFLDNNIDPLGAGWQVNQSLIAIGSGGWAGKGFLAQGTQNDLGFLPATAAHNDFIFAVIGEEFGFIGCAALIGAFVLLLLGILFVAYNSRDDLGTLFCVGTAGLIFTHMVMNVGMTVSVLPVTGLPLPLISYGGTFAVLVMFMLGVVQSVWIHRKKEAAPRRTMV